MEDAMTYQAMNYEKLLGTEGFSNQLLNNHFTLYNGYVTNTNKLMDELAELEKQGKTGTPQFAEMKRRFGWEFDGMRLHELYFGNMVKGGAAPDTLRSNCAQKLPRTLVRLRIGRSNSKPSERCAESAGRFFTMIRRETSS